MRVIGDVVELLPSDLPAAWRGIAEWTEENGLWQPWRLTRRTLRCAHSEVLSDRAKIPNGGRVVIRTDAAAAELDFVGDALGEGQVDVLVDGALVTTHTVPAGRSTLQVPVPSGVKVVEIWLPHGTRAAISPLRLHGATLIEPGPVGTRRWIAYGSSLTQSSGTAGPSTTWPAQVSRQLGWELTALGMAGECQLDPSIARQIAETPSDLVFLCLGANVHGAATYNERSLPSVVSGFVDRVRDGHRAVPIVVMSPITMNDFESTTNAVGLTLGRLRELVASAVETLTDLGDGFLSLIDGSTIVTATDHDLLSDGMHPTPEGYDLMAQRIAPLLSQAMVAG